MNPALAEPEFELAHQHNGYHHGGSARNLVYYDQLQSSLKRAKRPHPGRKSLERGSEEQLSHRRVPFSAIAHWLICIAEPDAHPRPSAPCIPTRSEHELHKRPHLGYPDHNTSEGTQFVRSLPGVGCLGEGSGAEDETGDGLARLADGRDLHWATINSLAVIKRG